MPINIERDGPAALVTLRRPEAFNAFDSAHLRQLLLAINELSDDPAVRVVVLTGDGSRAFAAGADIKEMAEMSPTVALAFARLGHAVTNGIAGAPQPWIAAVNGWALGGGCEVALACDIRIASENAVFGQPEVGLGVVPGWGGTQRLPRLLGAGAASEIIFTGRRVKADEALRIGLVSAVVPSDELLPRARELAALIAAQAPLAVAAAKRAIANIHNTDLAAGLEFEQQIFALCFDTADQREGMSAFVDKRPANFSGA